MNLKPENLKRRHCLFLPDADTFTNPYGRSVTKKKRRIKFIKLEVLDSSEFNFYDWEIKLHQINFSDYKSMIHISEYPTSRSRRRYKIDNLSYEFKILINNLIWSK